MRISGDLPDFLILLLTHGFQPFVGCAILNVLMDGMSLTTGR